MRVDQSLIDEIYKQIPPTASAAFLSGSQISGLAGPQSDLDVYILSLEQAKSTYFTYQSLKVELKTIQEEQLYKLKGKIKDLPRTPMNFWDQYLCYLIYIGRPIYRPAYYRYWKQQFDWNQWKSWMIDDRLRAFHSLNKEAWSHVKTGDSDTIYLCTRHAIEHLMDALLFVKGDFATKEKWRMKKVRRTLPEFYEPFRRVLLYPSHSLEAHLQQYRDFYNRIIGKIEEEERKGNG